MSVYVWHSLSVHALLLSLRSILPPLPPPMVSCHVLLYFNKYWTSWCILPAPPCGTGYPSCGFVVFQLSVRAREEGEPAPPSCGTGWFSLLPYTHTHTHHVFVNVWPFYLPTPLLCNRTVFPFALRHTHTHTPRVCVSLRTCSSAKPPFHSLVWGQATYDTGCGTPVVGVLRGGGGVRHACRGGLGVLQASRLHVFGGGYHWEGGGGGGGGGRGGGGAENAQRTTIYIYIYIWSPPPPMTDHPL